VFRVPYYECLFAHAIENFTCLFKWTMNSSYLQCYCNVGLMPTGRRTLPAVPIGFWRRYDSVAPSTMLPAHLLYRPLSATTIVRLLLPAVAAPRRRTARRSRSSYTMSEKRPPKFLRNDALVNTQMKDAFNNSLNVVSLKFKSCCVAKRSAI